MIARAAVLAAGVLVYLAFLQYGRQVALTELARIQYLYTTAATQTAASTTAYTPEAPGSSQLGAMSLSK